MKNLKHLLFVSLLLTCVSFLSSCGNDDETSSSPSDVVVTGVAKNVTSNSAELTGSIYLDRISVSYTSLQMGIELSETSDFSSSQLITTKTITENNTIAVCANNLTPSTQYYYRTYVRVQSINYNGATKSFTTSARPAVNKEYVDLGLPSGTLWATCNVGANSPEEYGDYFAWGETTTKSNYSWETYKWCKGDYDQLTKYCYDSKEGYKGFTDYKRELDLEDDAAYVNMGNTWHTPSGEQQDELREKCTWTWTTLNGVYGREVKGPNGNSIFLPAAGARYEKYLPSYGISGEYLSRSLRTNVPSSTYYLLFEDDVLCWDGSARCVGRSVRAVRR